MGYIIRKKGIIVTVIILGIILVITFLLLIIFPRFSKPYSSERARVDSVVQGTSSFSPTVKSSLNPDFTRRQGELADLAKKIDADLESGKISDAQVKLIEFKGRVRKLGDILKSEIIPIEVQRKHDPEGNYLKPGADTRIDPQVLPLYLKTIDLLVAFDKNK